MVATSSVQDANPSPFPLQDIQELSITIAAKELDPTLLSEQFLKFSGIVPNEWELARQPVLNPGGSQVMFKNGVVYIEDANKVITKFPFINLSNQDQAFVNKKNDWIKRINIISPQKKLTIQRVFDYKFWIILFSLLLFGLWIYSLSDRKKLKYLYPVFFIGITISLYGFTKKFFQQQIQLF